MSWPLLQAATVEVDCFDVTPCHRVNLFETTYKMNTYHSREYTHKSEIIFALLHKRRVSLFVIFPSVSADHPKLPWDSFFFAALDQSLQTQAHNHNPVCPCLCMCWDVTWRREGERERPGNKARQGEMEKLWKVCGWIFTVEKHSSPPSCMYALLKIQTACCFCLILHALSFWLGQHLAVRLFWL